MSRETTHSAECWRWHESCRRTVLDEATEATALYMERQDWTRHMVADILRIAADRLRAERDLVNAPAWPPNEYLDGLRAGYGNAADTLTEGVNPDGQ